MSKAKASLGGILSTPRLPRSLGKPRRPEVVALYNHFRTLITGSPWREYTPPPLGRTYPRWALLFDRCVAEGLEAQAYLSWIFAQGVLAHPGSLLPFALAEGTLWRFRRSLVAPSAPRNGAYGTKLVDDRTGEPVSWIFNANGEPLVTPPPEGEVFDEGGHRIPLRRFS